MPNRKINKSAEKAARQSVKKRGQARIVKGFIRDVMRDFRTEKDPKVLAKSLPLAFSALDKAAKKKTVHPRTVARNKSRLAKHLNKANKTAP